MIELKELVDKTKEIFECEVESLGGRLMSACLTNDHKKMDCFLEAVNKDLKTDYMQMIFQYYMADRKNLGQDYTPKSLAKLLQRLAGESDSVTDMCAGSGALSIAYWAENKKSKFELLEFDKTVIPYLIFNMVIRNIECVVKQIDVLSGKVEKTYNIAKGEKYGRLICQ